MRTLAARLTLSLGRDARFHLLTLVAVGIAYYGFFGVAFPLYALRLGYGTGFIGLLGAAGTLLFIALGLPAAAFGRRHGPRAGLLLGTGAYTVGFTLLPCADLLPDPITTPWLIGCYLLGFMGGPFYWVNGNLYLAAATAPEERGRAYALRTALLPIAGVLGSLAGGLVATVAASFGEGASPYRTVLFLGGLAYLPALLATRASADLRPPAEGPRRSAAAPWRTLIGIGAVEVARTAGEVGARGWLGVRLDGFGIGAGAIGASTALGLAASALAALATPRLTHRWGERRAVPLALAGMAGGLALLALPHPAATVAGATVAISAAALAGAALSAHRLRLVAPSAWPALAGAVVSSQGIGETAAMAGGGWAIAAVGFAPLYLATAGVLLIAALAVRAAGREGVNAGSGVSR